MRNFYSSMTWPVSACIAIDHYQTVRFHRTGRTLSAYRGSSLARTEETTQAKICSPSTSIITYRSSCYGADVWGQYTYSQKQGAEINGVIMAEGKMEPSPKSTCLPVDLR
ncbi:unnamed protein product [Absidia cylindrospora]